MTILCTILLFATQLGTPLISGRATFYCSDGRDGSPVSPCTRGYGPDDLVAAIDRKDTPWDKGDWVVVTGAAGSVTVRIVDTCECAGARIIDLPIGAFETVAGDWRPGDVPIEVEGVPDLPETDTEEP